ncbi:MAG: GNAT family N-acetyltransferase [Puia sp.]|nr:GNAT family N-acetyltransferase [Puia sp.]
MAEVITFPNYTAFYLQNIDALQDDYINHFYLIHLMDDVAEGKLGWRDFFNVVDDDGSQAIVLLVDERCLIFCERWNPAVIAAVSRKLHFEKFKRFMFGGFKPFLQALFDSDGATFHIIKDRISYRCAQLSSAFTPVPGRLEMAHLSDLDELAQMSYEYSQEEYHGKGRDYAHIRNIVQGGILQDNFYAWRDQGAICAIAQVIDSDGAPPFIGHLFTHKEKRNRGYAGSILQAITQGLLREGHEACGLVSDADNPASNKVFVKVGYVPIGTYVTATKEMWRAEDID